MTTKSNNLNNIQRIQSKRFSKKGSSTKNLSLLITINVNLSPLPKWNKQTDVRSCCCRGQCQQPLHHTSLNHGSRVVKSLKQNRAKSRIAWNNVVPANVQRRRLTTFDSNGGLITKHAPHRPCPLFISISLFCVHTGARRIDDAEDRAPETVNFIANRYLRIVESLSFNPRMVAILKIRVIFPSNITFSIVLENFISRDSDKLIDLLLLLLLGFVIS